MNIDEITARVFARLGEEKQLHEYHEIMYKLLGVVIDFINANGVSLKLSKGKNFNPFCARLRECAPGRALCDACDVENARMAAQTKQVMVYHCHAGFVEILVPLFGADGRYIGSMTAGQFHLAGEIPPSREKIAALAVSLGLDAQELCRLSTQTLCLTSLQTEGLIEYLKTIGRLLAGTHNNLMFMETVNAPDKIDLIRQYVADHYRKPLNAAKMARKFFLSPAYFSRFFRSGTGIGFNSYLNFYRVSKAKEMLSETELSVSEIAFLCGFGSISQFNRVFRSVTKSSPRLFRWNLGPH